MRAGIIALATLVVAVLIGVATALFRPSSNDVPLEPITVEVPADMAPRAPTVRDVYPQSPALGPAETPAPVPDARTQVPPPPPAVTDVPPPPPAVVGDDDDDDDGAHGGVGDDDD